MTTSRFFAAVLSLLLYTHGFAQQPTTVIDSLSGHLIKNIRTDNKDRIILQTDRKVYAAGEKIWFNAFLIRKINNRLDTSSKNLFIDLVNDKDSVVSRAVLKVAKFNMNGALAINDTVYNGYYWLRCYTKKILRENVNDVYVQPVFIINRNKSGDPYERPAYDAGQPKTANIPNDPVINFYPEGGAVITGINSTVVVQVTDGKGNPVSVSGYVANEADSTVANFTTNKFGLARITFYPYWYHKYSAVIQRNRGIKYPLPSFNPFAGQVAVSSQNEEYINAVVTLEDSIFSKKATTYLLGISGDSVYYAAVGKGMYNVYIPVNRFPGGIATLLLFDDAQHLLSERKVFIRKDNCVVSLQTDKKNYAARDKVDMAVAVTDSKGMPLVAALNVSVQDQRVQTMSDAMETDTLQPALPLNEWLKRNSKKFSADDIDMMMIAQQPEFKNWQANSSVIESTIEGDEETELLRYLHGQVTGKKNMPLKGMVVTEILKKSDDFFFDVDTTNVDGKFRLPIPPNKDSLMLNLQVKDKSGYPQLDDNIIIDTFNFPQFATPVALKQKFFSGTVNIPRWLKANYADTLFTNAGKGWLKPVIVKGKVQKQENYDVSKRLDRFSSIITSDMLANGGYHAVGNALLRVPGVSMSQGFITIFGGDGQGGHPSSEPILIVDGQEVMPQSIREQFVSHSEADASPVLNYLNNFLGGQDIDFIEVLTGGNAAIYGMRGGNGVIVVHTKARYVQNYAHDNGFKLVTPVTYHVAPKFNMPDYDDKIVKSNKEPDARNTIYWNGNIITGTDGKAYVNFYTADAATTYIVTITGITQKGDYINKRILINRK